MSSTIASHSEKNLRIALLALGLIGLIDSAYLAYIKLANATASCAGIGNCDAVNSSKYAEIAGIPIALLGGRGLPDHAGAVIPGKTRWFLAGAISAFHVCVDPDRCAILCLSDLYRSGSSLRYLPVLCPFSSCSGYNVWDLGLPIYQRNTRVGYKIIQ